MGLVAYSLLLYAALTAAKFCPRTSTPFEYGQFNGRFERLDSTTIETKPVTELEGQVYVYENTFPGYTIKYLTVDNAAHKTCGAWATLKGGGVGTSTVLLILQADANDEIRSVIDVWGERNKAKIKKPWIREGELKNMRSKYLMNLRAVNYNSQYDWD